ncbi:hypothetical protein CCHL11_02265 [Colletotrichum chlorophyti]|uniref:Uncharacterized protein n=1 Tax=Colletotrichum chlorophyti TaxID=708187 RepID=A0A1Q8S614_9PEZI|nr:hypothetical protein CCHL11_02265 [Colletotrichum chlorophyti]
MFRFTTTPIRQGGHLLRSVVQPVTRITAPPSVVSRRTYAIKGKKKLAPSPIAKAARNRPRRDVVFETRPFPYFRSRHKELEIKHVTAKEAYDIYINYMKALAVPNKAADWQQQFVKDNNTTPAGVYEVATFVSHFPNIAGDEYHLQCMMMNTAAEMKYEIAALSLGRQLYKAKSKQNYFNFEQPRWQKARAICLRLIKEGRNANALVLNGLMHLERKTDRDDYLALEAFHQAEALAKDSGFFDWLASCLEGQGEAYLRLGEKNKAIDVFTRLAARDFPQGYWRLAQVLPNDPSYLELLSKAAASGIFDAFEPLMKEHDKLRQRSLDMGNADEALYHEREAAEWGRLFKANKEYDIQKETNYA